MSGERKGGGIDIDGSNGYAALHKYKSEGNVPSYF